MEANYPGRRTHHQERQVAFSSGYDCRTLVHKAVLALRSEIHWVLSGTPLQNTVSDLYSLFRFLRYEPWCYVGKAVESKCRKTCGTTSLTMEKKRKKRLRADRMHRVH